MAMELQALQLSGFSLDQGRMLRWSCKDTIPVIRSDDQSPIAPAASPALLRPPCLTRSPFLSPQYHMPFHDPVRSAQMATPASNSLLSQTRSSSTAPVPDHDTWPPPHRTPRDRHSKTEHPRSSARPHPSRAPSPPSPPA